MQVELHSESSHDHPVSPQIAVTLTNYCPPILEASIWKIIIEFLDVPNSDMNATDCTIKNGNSNELFVHTPFTDRQTNFDSPKHSELLAEITKKTTLEKASEVTEIEQDIEPDSTFILSAKKCEDQPPPLSFNNVNFEQKLQQQRHSYHLTGDDRFIDPKNLENIIQVEKNDPSVISYPEDLSNNMINPPNKEKCDAHTHGGEKQDEKIDIEIHSPTTTSVVKTIEKINRNEKVQKNLSGVENFKQKIEEPFEKEFRRKPPAQNKKQIVNLGHDNYILNIIDNQTIEVQFQSANDDEYSEVEEDHTGNGDESDSHLMGPLPNVENQSDEEENEMASSSITSGPPENHTSLTFLRDPTHRRNFSDNERFRTANGHYKLNPELPKNDHRRMKSESLAKGDPACVYLQNIEQSNYFEWWNELEKISQEQVCRFIMINCGCYPHGRNLNATTRKLFMDETGLEETKCEQFLKWWFLEKVPSQSPSLSRFNEPDSYSISTTYSLSTMESGHNCNFMDAHKSPHILDPEALLQLTDEMGYIVPADPDDMQQKTHKDVIKFNKRVEKWQGMLCNGQNIMDGTLEQRNENWNSVARHRKLKSRIRKGIPSPFRGEVWVYLSNSRKLRLENPGVYTNLLKKLQVTHNVHESQIEKDIERTFRKQINFREKDSPMRQSLSNVLCCYALHNPEIGYCQGMSSVIALMLCYMEEIDAFWVLESLNSNDKYCMKGVWHPNMPLINLRFYQFEHLVRYFLPTLADHFENEGIFSCSQYQASQWFITGYLATTIPYPIKHMMWDIYLNEGVKVLFRFGLAILHIFKDKLLKSDLEGIINTMRNDVSELDEAFIARSLRLKITTSMLERAEREFYQHRHSEN